MLKMANCEADGLMFREFTEEAITAVPRDDKDGKKIKPDVSLADGMPLPKYLRNDFPDGLFGKPILEIDPFYVNKYTFVVISTNWVIHRFSSFKSLWFLTPANELRWFCIRTITHWAFRYFMIIAMIYYVIFYLKAGTIALGLPIMTIFVVEMNLKIIAKGFLLQPFSYLRNPWNWIDFILTPIGLAYLFTVSTDNPAHSIHPINTLRILRFIHFYTHSRLTCSWMFRSLCRMKDPFLFGAFMFLLFTIYAQQFLMGVLSNRCIQETMATIEDSEMKFVTPLQLHSNKTEIQIDFLPFVCGNVSGSRACPNDSFVCKEGIQNPDNGYTSFDSFPLAAVSIMRLMARDLWDDLYMQIHSSIGPWKFPFVLIVIVYGGFYYVNLLLAYIAVGITELLQILEGKKPQRKSVKTGAKKAVSNGMGKDSSQDADIPLIDVDAQNHTKEEGEGVSVVLEQPGTNECDHKNDGDVKDPRWIYRRRRGPIGVFVMPYVDLFCDWKCCPCWVGLRSKLTPVVQSIYFNIFIAFCIILNAVVRTLGGLHSSREAEIACYFIELAIAFIFVVEAILKILALSPRHYFKDSMNVFDFIIVVSIIVNFIFMEVLGMVFGTSVFRLFRLFRVFQMTSWWPYMGDLIKICGTNVWALLILVFTFARMAEGIFEDPSHGMYSRWNFSTYLNSMTTVFRMLCGEWIEPLWGCLPGNSGSYCLPYFFCVILVGNLALFTLFVTMLAVALNSNNLSETGPVSDHNLISIIKKFIKLSHRWMFGQTKLLEEQTVRKSREELVNMSADDEARMPVAQPTFGMDVVGPCWCDSCYTFLPCCGSASGTSTTANQTPFWGTWENFRSFSLRLIHNTYFGYGMNTFIFLSCITQAWNDHELTSVFFHTIYNVMNYLVIIIYSLEICLQMSGLGCKTYFTNGWHLFDFLITVLHIISMVVPSLKPPFGFRPFKFIPRLKRLRAVISATFYKLSSLVDVLLACSILWLFFALLGVAMFLGLYQKCIDDSGLRFEVYSAEHCMEMRANGTNVSFVNHYYHFDDAGNAFVSLLQVASRKGWITIMHTTFDSLYFDEPRQDINIVNSYYFFAFFIIGVLCCFTFILATFIRKTNVQRKQIIGGYIEILMTDLQRQAFARKKNHFFISPVKVSPCPEWRPRRLAYQMVSSWILKLIIIIITMLNAIGLALISLEASKEFGDVIFKMDIVFFVVFVLEVLLRIAAFGRNFFARGWNIYDFVVLVASVLVYVLHPFLPGYIPSPMLSGPFRIVRLVRWLKWVRRIGSRLLHYLPALDNVALLLSVIILAYGSMALRMYRHVPINAFDIHHLDFGYLGPSLMSFSMMGFGSSWEVIIQNYEGSGWLVLSFLAIFYLIVLQAGAVLFLEHYHLLVEKRRLGLTDDALEAFETAWKILDPEATGYIGCDHLPMFLSTLLPPLQICLPNRDEVAAMDVPIYKGDNVAFNDVLLALLARLDDHETSVKTVGPKSEDVISSTLQRHLEVEAAIVQQEFQEN